MAIPGDDEEDALLCPQDQPGLGADAVSWDDDVDPLDAFTSRPAIAGHGLNVIAPDTGGVDHASSIDPKLPSIFQVGGLDA